MKDIIINDVNLGQYDIFDADLAEKYEVALDKASKPVKTEGLKTSAIIRQQCEVVFNVFNELFGEGAADKVFGTKTNIRVCLAAFGDLVEQINSQKDEVDKMTAKYSPNRAQRRAKK